MNAAAVIGFWAAVMGGVLMYLVAGREVVEAWREWRRRDEPARAEADAAWRRLELLAMAFLGFRVEVATGEGVVLEQGTGRPLRILVASPAGPAGRREMFLQASRLASGGYTRSAAILEPARREEYQAVLDAGLLAELIFELPGGPWLEADRKLAGAGALLREVGRGQAPASALGAPWRWQRVAPETREAAARKLRPSEGIEESASLVPEAPKRLTQESRKERQGIFFIRFESVQEWTEDFLDLDRPAEEDGSTEGYQNTGTLTRKATLSRRGSASRRDLLAAADEDHVWLPEWDVDRRCYKPRYCRVLVRDGWEQPEECVLRSLRDRLAPQVRRMERQLELLRMHRRRQRGQPTGSEVDIAAWVRFRADLAAGAACDPTRLYQAVRPRRRELTVGTLVDLSASTEIPCGDRRVVDVERDAVYLLARAVERLGDRHGAWGFTSQGAGQVQVMRLKRLDEPLASAEARLCGLGPYANTRMGAAIRWVTLRLSRHSAESKLLFVVTDGKPHDDDGYVGEYAMADTCRAIQEARAQGIQVIGLGIGPDAQEGMSALFAPHFVSVLRVESLPRSLAGLYLRLAAPGGRS